MRKLKLKELGRVDIDTYKTEVEKLPLVVVLDNIRSAHNVGSIFRTADAMAISKVYLCGITPQPPSREITKTAIGATESVDWEYIESTADLLKHLNEKGYTTIAIEQTDASIELMSYDIGKGPYTIVLGNEVDGVSSEALEQCKSAIELNQYGTKHSLNVSVCGGIVIHHFAERLRK